MTIAPETLSAYVPQLLIRQLSQQPGPPVPCQTTITAVTLLADISGFTALTEQLSQAGPEGVETLTQILNDAFDIAISPAIARGGDVAKFAGDAFLAIWPFPTDSSIQTSSERQPLQQAARAALDIQANFRQFAAERAVDIGLRIGIGVGAIDWVLVGGISDRWLFLLTGASLQQLQRTLKAADPGQVVVSAEGYTQLAPLCHGHRLAGGEYVLHSVQQPASVPTKSVRTSSQLAATVPFNSLHSSATKIAPKSDAVVERGNSPEQPLSSSLKAFIPITVLSRLEAGQKDWLAEFRQITAVFIHLPDWRGECPLDQRQQTVAALQALTQQYEGNLAFAVDEKGVSALVTFGLPQRTHTNDPERGVRIAIAIRELLLDAGWHCSIGVATGRVFCGAVGNPLRREYTTIGGAVNLAARLMQAAERREDAVTILCDRTTHAAARQALDFNAHAPVTVKGRADTVSVFSPLVNSTGVDATQAPSQSAQPSLAVVGRDAEYTVFATALQALVGHRQGGGIVLEGEAGIGKSQLLKQLRRLANEREISVLAGGGDSIEKQVPYRAWRPIFTHVLNIEGRSQQESLQHLRHRLQDREEWLPLLPLLTAVLDFEIPDSPTTQTMQGQVRADNTRLLLLDILRDRLEHPAIVVLDDAHWMDSASWQLAQTVLDQLPHLLLAVASRPLDESLPDSYIAITQSPNTHFLRLDSLAPEPTRQLLCRCLRTEAISDRLLDAIYTKSQGQPLFSEQLALALQAAGYIECSDRTCDLSAPISQYPQQELPNSIRGAIVSRLDRLHPNHQLVLKTASAIGRRFQTSVLQDIYPVPVEEELVPQSLQTLSQRKFTALWAGQPELTYQFIHVITQEVAYSLMVFSQRRELHRSAAQWYEQHAPEAEPSILAYHWERAEQWDKALHYLGLAGERALRDGANTEAVDFLERAIALERNCSAQQYRRSQARGANPSAATSALCTPFQRARWHRQLGDAYVGLGNLSASGTALKTAVAILDRHFPRTSLELAIRSLRELLIQLLRRSGLVRSRQSRSGEEQANTQTLKEMSLACTHLGEVYYYSNRKSLATFATLHGLNLAEQAGPSPELARIYANMCFATGVNNAHWLARTYARLATQTTQIAPQPTADAWVDLVLGAYHSGVGNWVSARQQTLAASERFEQLRDLHRQGEALTSLAAIAHWQGDYSTAIGYWRHARQLGERFGDVQAQLWGLLGEAEEYLVGDNWTLATELVERAKSLGERRQDLTCEQFRMQALLAQIRLRQGRRSEASRLALAALDEVAGLAAVVLYLMEGYASTTAVLLALWAEAPQDEQLMADARVACSAHSRYATTFGIARPRALLHQGIWHRIARHPKRAVRSFQRCLHTAEQLQMPYETACAHWQLGSLHIDSSSQRAVHLTTARERFQSLGIDAPDKLLLHT